VALLHWSDAEGCGAQHAAGDMIVNDTVVYDTGDDTIAEFKASLADDGQPA
jgi:hypothetical protein